MIYWPILKLKESGITDILIVTNQNDLHAFIELLGMGEELNVSLYYQIQKNEGGGIADALTGARNFIGTDKVVVLLGDNVFQDSLVPHIKSFEGQESGAKVLLKEVKDPKRYGVPVLDETGRRILSIIEKPEVPPSSYCVTGIYMYDNQVFSFIEGIQPSNRNELEITDVNNLYIKNNQLHYELLTGWWIDAGTHHSLFQASKYIYESSTQNSNEG